MCVDFVKHYSRKHLDESFVKKNKHILSQPRGAGYWLWKPYIILKTLNEVPEGDILVYADGGLFIKKPLDSLINKMLDANKDVLLFENHHDNMSYMKRDALIYMNMDSDEFRKKTQVVGAILIMKNTKYSRTFIKEWLDLCGAGDLITDAPGTSPEYPEFKDHRHDQSLLSLISYKYPEKLMLLPFRELKESFVHHRRRYLDSSLLLSKNT